MKRWTISGSSSKKYNAGNIDAEPGSAGVSVWYFQWLGCPHRFRPA